MACTGPRVSIVDDAPCSWRRYWQRSQRVFDLLVVRVHARLWADLASTGAEVGAHDRLVAATAMSAGWQVGTANVRHFERVSGLEIAPVQLT
jgi:predicted nucleic acid-binding protein